MDLVLVGLPGSGKTAVGRALAGAHDVPFVDVDAEVERVAGAPVPAIFEGEGEVGFRERERAVVTALGPADRSLALGRVISVGGGAVADPRTRWMLYRGRTTVWLDAPIEVLAARVANEPGRRPLLASGDLAAALGQLLAARVGGYAAATARVDASLAVEAASVAISEAVDAVITEAAAHPLDAAGGGAVAAAAGAAMLLRLETSVGRLALGVGTAAAEIDRELRAAGGRRAILVSEPGAWRAAGRAIAEALESRGWRTERLLLPPGEAAKRLAVVADAAERLAELGLERDEPVVAIGGGALTDAAGFVAATFARGVPWLAVPTTFVGQVDAALGGKTAVDLDHGKNLVGAFHPPVAVIADVAFLETLAESERRAALAEAVKVGILGEAGLLATLEADGPAIAAGTPAAFETGAAAEVVERAARFKLAVVERDPRERGERICLNLGHSLGHAIEAASGFGPVRHGEAVAYGLRAAARLAVARDAATEARAARIEALLDDLALGIDPLPGPVGTVLAHLGRDKKRRGGAFRWILPTEDGWTVDPDVPELLVEAVTTSVLAGRLAAVDS